MDGQHWNVDGWQCHLYEAEGTKPLVVMPYLQGDGQALKAACAALKVPAFHLLILNHADWNDCYSPWVMPSPFEQGVLFKGAGAETLASLVESVLPSAEAHLQANVNERALVGYSMAGLFALYGVMASDAFTMGASVSGSLWAPGLEDFLRAQLPKHSPGRFYFSLGNKERKTRNPLLVPLATQTTEAERLLREAGVQTTYEINPGNHFTEPDERVARAIRWLLMPS